MGDGRPDLVRTPPPDRRARLEAWSTLHPGIDPHGGVVGGWLRVVDVLAAPLAAARVPPDVVTALGLASAAGATAAAAGSGGRRGVAVAGLVALSAVLDGLDGAVAVRTGRVTARGARLDSAADRTGEACFGAALWLLGAPSWLAAGGVAAGWAVEGMRHRLRRTREADVLVVTVGERPTRVAVTAMFALATAVLVESDGIRARSLATAGAATLVGTGVVALAQLTRARRRDRRQRLRRDRSAGRRSRPTCPPGAGRRRDAWSHRRGTARRPATRSPGG